MSVRIDMPHRRLQEFRIVDYAEVAPVVKDEVSKPPDLARDNPFKA